MTEASLKTLIETTLKIPVYEGQSSIIYPAATLEIIGHPSALNGDGKSEVRETEAVINLWYTGKSARDTDTGLMLAALGTQNGISVPECYTEYDTTAKKYRSVIRFNFIPRST